MDRRSYLSKGLTLLWTRASSVETADLIIWFLEMPRMLGRRLATRRIAQARVRSFNWITFFATFRLIKNLIFVKIV